MGIFKKISKRGLFAKFWKTITIMTFVYGIALFCYALLKSSDLYDLRAVNNLSTTQLFKNISNNSELASALKIAQEKNLPVLLNFTAEWCSSCIYIENTVFKDPNVIKTMQKFILLKVDLTKIDEQRMKLIHQFNLAGPPAILFYKNGKFLNLQVGGEISAEKFNHILQLVLEPSDK